mmetsp:Transcript_34150/g.47546  ORF Transcript_34150/g.47546 Transcript_34150/m.47546 type:complete len:600 (+) Transcript_34150:74-1873(+)
MQDLGQLSFSGVKSESNHKRETIAPISQSTSSGEIMNPLTSIIKSKKDKPMYEPPTGVVPFPLPPLISTGTAHIKPSDEANAAIECNVNSGGTVNIENRNDGLLNIESVAALLPEKMVDDPSSKFIALDSATNNKEESRLKEAIRKARKIAASMSASSMFVDEIITVLEKEADELRHQQCEDDFRRKEEEVLQKGKKKETRVTMSSVEYVDSIINILENEAEQERGGGGSSSSSSSSSHGDDIYDKTTIASKIDEESCPFEFELLLPPKKNISVLLQSSNEKDKKKKKSKGDGEATAPSAPTGPMLMNLLDDTSAATPPPQKTSSLSSSSSSDKKKTSSVPQSLFASSTPGFSRQLLYRDNAICVYFTARAEKNQPFTLFVNVYLVSLIKKLEVARLELENKYEGSSEAPNPTAPIFNVNGLKSKKPKTASMSLEWKTFDGPRVIPATVYYQIPGSKMIKQACVMQLGCSAFFLPKKVSMGDLAAMITGGPTGGGGGAARVFKHSASTKLTLRGLSMQDALRAVGCILNVQLVKAVAGAATYYGQSVRSPAHHVTVYVKAKKDSKKKLTVDIKASHAFLPEAMCAQVVKAVADLPTIPE